MIIPRKLLFIKVRGETSPIITMRSNIFERNCESLYGNFTACRGAVYLELQNTPNFFFHNNLLKDNEGGLRLNVNAQSAAAALNGLLMNNLFVGNRKNEALYMKGPEQGSYQLADVLRNYFAMNKSPYRDNIVLAQVVTNFTENVVVGNLGKTSDGCVRIRAGPVFISNNSKKLVL